jgi:hypothetical protein
MATILDLGNPNVPLPTFLLIDASVLLAIRLPPGVGPNPRGADTRQFLRRVRQSYNHGNTVPLVCITTLEECYFKIISNKFRSDPSLSSRRATVAARLRCSVNQVGWHRLYKDYPQFIQNCSADLQSFYQFVVGIPLTILEPEDLVNPGVEFPPIEGRMQHYILSCSILPKDAYLIAVAERLGVNHIATLDQDFARLGSGFTIYTVP